MRIEYVEGYQFYRPQCLVQLEAEPITVWDVIKPLAFNAGLLCAIAGAIMLLVPNPAMAFHAGFIGGVLAFLYLKRLP